MSGLMVGAPAGTLTGTGVAITNVSVGNRVAPIELLGVGAKEVGNAIWGFAGIMSKTVVAIVNKAAPIRLSKPTLRRQPAVSGTGSSCTLRIPIEGLVSANGSIG